MIEYLRTIASRDRGQVRVPPSQFFLKTFVKSQCRTVLATSNAIIQLLNKEEDMMKEAYAQSIECEEPCEGRLSRTVL